MDNNTINVNNINEESKIINNQDKVSNSVDNSVNNGNSQNKKLKVLMGMDIYLPQVDGVVNCMHNYCLNLNDYCDVTAIAPQHIRQDEVKTPYKIIRCKSMYLPFVKYQYGTPNRDKKFKEEIYSKDYDIIHIHSPFGMAKFALKLAKEKNIPIVISHHSNIEYAISKYAKFRWITKYLLKKIGDVYNQFDKVYAVSNVVADQVRRLGYKGEIELLPLGTELERVSEQEIERNRKIANKQFNLKEDDLVFLYVGRVVKLKRIDFTLQALKILKDKGLKFKFFVVGKGNDINKLKNLANKLGLSEDEVVFTGFLDRELLPIINSRADLFLFPSIYDTFGLVKVEAGAYNTPGVFVENSCAADGVKDNFNGFLTKDDEVNYANTIARAVENIDNLKRVGQRAGDTLYITWKDCTDSLYKAYQKVIDEYHTKNKNTLNN